MSKRKRLPATCLAIIVCEGVVEDARSHNKCILNLFNVIWSESVPVAHDRLTVFLALTDVHGELPLRLTFGLHGQEPVFDFKGKVKTGSPRDVADLVLDMRQVPIPAFGEYAVNVEVAGEMVGTRRVLVRQAKMPGRKAE